MKLRHAATIVTVLVLIAGFAMISPLFYRPNQPQPKQQIMLSFNISNSNPKDIVEWSQNLSLILTKYNLPATVFIVGHVADQHPQTVTVFNEKIDIGSQTYRNIDLTSITDYTLKLQEVKQGKAAVDNAGQLNSSIFRAPKGGTDQDIYSLLSRSGIMADFSYTAQYNLYQNGQFVKFNASVFDAAKHPSSFFLGEFQVGDPVIIEFSDDWSTSEIDSYLQQLRLGDFWFVNASELVGFALTKRGT